MVLVIFYFLIWEELSWRYSFFLFHLVLHLQCTCVCVFVPLIKIIKVHSAIWNFKKIGISYPFLELENEGVDRSMLTSYLYSRKKLSLYIWEMMWCTRIMN